MVTKKIRSEYMKKFKDPKWDTYAKCYEDSLKYRLSRRLLEQSHRPWVWEGWESDSDCSDRGTPQGGKKLVPKAEEERRPGPEPVPEPQRPENQQREALEPQVSGPERAQAEAEEPPHAALQATVKKDPMKKHERALIGKEGLQAAHLDGQQKGVIQPRWPRKATRAKSQPREGADLDKENRHPFALYGVGEKPAEMAARRTHNVGPCASTREIHASALRAKTRREVEKQLKAQGRRRARSADVEARHHTKLVPDFDPWMTEYMRCFSARSR